MVTPGPVPAQERMCLTAPRPKNVDRPAIARGVRPSLVEAAATGTRLREARALNQPSIRRTPCGSAELQLRSGSPNPPFDGHRPAAIALSERV